MGGFVHSKKVTSLECTYETLIVGFFKFKPSSNSYTLEAKCTTHPFLRNIKIDILNLCNIQSTLDNSYNLGVTPLHRSYRNLSPLVTLSQKM